MLFYHRRHTHNCLISKLQYTKPIFCYLFETRGVGDTGCRPALSSTFLLVDQEGIFASKEVGSDDTMLKRVTKKLITVLLLQMICTF